MYVALVHNHPTWKNCQVNPAMLQGQKLWTPTVQDVFKTAQVCKVKPKDSSKYFLGDQDYPNMLVCIKDDTILLHVFLKPHRMFIFASGEGWFHQKDSKGHTKDDSSKGKGGSKGKGCSESSG